MLVLVSLRKCEHLDTYEHDASEEEKWHTGHMYGHIGLVGKSARVHVCLVFMHFWKKTYRIMVILAVLL